MKRIKELQWFSQIADLKPTEMLWLDLKRSCAYVQILKNFNELVQRWEREWTHWENYLENYFFQVIAAKGGSFCLMNDDVE